MDAAIITGICTLLGTSVAAWLKERWTKKREKKKLNITKNLITKNTIKHHSIFEMLNYWINVRISKAKFGENKYHNNWAKILLKSKYNSALINIKKTINNKSIGTFNDDILWTHFLSMINDIIQEYEEETLKKGVPKLFIEKFMIWHSKTRDIILKNTELICKSKYYHNNFEKIYAILNLLLTSYDVTLIDSEQTLKNLNGELDEYIQKIDKFYKTCSSDNSSKENSYNEDIIEI
jgi:hypothetical protein